MPWGRLLRTPHQLRSSCQPHGHRAAPDLVDAPIRPGLTTPGWPLAASGRARRAAIFSDPSVVITASATAVVAVSLPELAASFSTRDFYATLSNGTGTRTVLITRAISRVTIFGP